MRLIFTIMTLLSLAAVAPATAEPRKTFINGFTVIGAANANELKMVFPALIMSRLDPAQFMPVGEKGAAEIEISGSYVVFGKAFTLDAAVQRSDGRVLFKGFEQGEREDQAPDALGRLAARIGRELATDGSFPGSEPATGLQRPVPPSGRPAERVSTTRDSSPGAFRETWSSQPLDGALVAMACGRKLPSGEREIFIAGERTVSYYHLGSDLKMIASAQLPASSKIIALDAADLDEDGTTEIYATIIDRETLSSRVYSPVGESLELVADALPYYFRQHSVDGKSGSMYVQQMGMESDFHGDISELAKNGGQFTLKKRLKLPEDLKIFGFIRTRAGRSENFAVIGDDGHLAVVSPSGEQLWKSGERFGGSATFFKREVSRNQSNSGDGARWTFLQQRLFTAADGGLLVPRNDGDIRLGNLRSYDGHSFHLLRWNGSAFREELQSGRLPGYLADYAYDRATGELITLLVTRKEGMLSRGRSAVTILSMDN